jgi:DNA polymerase-3 subunit beta
MHFICTQENLLKGVSAVSPLAGRNIQLPALQNVLLEVKEGVLHLTCTDLEVGAHVTVAGKMEEVGGCTVMARQLLEFIQQLPVSNPIKIKKEKNNLIITTKGFQASFPISKADDFPLLPKPAGDNSVMLDGRSFCQALTQTMFAAARDESRPEIHSVYVKGEKNELRVVATDSFRLAERVMKLDGVKANFSFLLPVSAAQEVTRLFSGCEQLSLATQENYIVFSGDGVYLSSRLIDSKYPDYNQIIPRSFITQGVVKKDELLRALKVLNVFLAKESRRVSLLVQPAKETMELKIEGGEGGRGEVTVPFKGKGEDVKVLFNINYLIDGAQRGGGDRSELGFGGENDPIMFSPHDSTVRHKYLIMPIQA